MKTMIKNMKVAIDLDMFGFLLVTAAMISTLVSPFLLIFEAYSLSVSFLSLGVFFLFSLLMFCGLAESAIVLVEDNTKKSKHYSLRIISICSLLVYLIFVFTDNKRINNGFFGEFLYDLFSSLVFLVGMYCLIKFTLSFVYPEAMKEKKIKKKEEESEEKLKYIHTNNLGSLLPEECRMLNAMLEKIYNYQDNFDIEDIHNVSSSVNYLNQNLNFYNEMEQINKEGMKSAIIDSIKDIEFQVYSMIKEKDEKYKKGILKNVQLIKNKREGF